MTEKFPLVSLFIAYGIVVSLLHLFGYWSTFNINILQFVSLSDVIALSIYPIFFSAIVYIVGIIALPIVSGDIYKQKYEEVFVQVSKRVGRWFSIVLFILISIILIFRQNGAAFLMVGLLLATIIHLHIQDYTVLKSLIPHPILRRFAGLALISIAFSSFGWGKIGSEKVLHGNGNEIIESAIFKGEGTEAFKLKKLLEGQTTLKYIGTAGDYFFFLTMDNSETIIAKYDDLHFLGLRKQKSDPKTIPAERSSP